MKSTEALPVEEGDRKANSQTTNKLANQAESADTNTYYPEISESLSNITCNVSEATMIVNRTHTNSTATIKMRTNGVFETERLAKMTLDFSEKNEKFDEKVGKEEKK